MSGALSTRVGLYFGLLQLTFGLIWVEYMIFLPQLASTAGIGGATASWILVLDQVIFALCDLAAGVAVDRVAKVVGRLGKIIVVLTAVSALAFLLLPFVARLSASVFIFLIVVWTITSAALRAPTLALLGRYTPVSRQHWVGSLFVIGVGLATASAPILGTRITAYDPRIAFGLSALAVFVATLAIIWAEKNLARTAPPETSTPAQVPVSTLISFLAAVLLLQIGFQVHWFINAEQFFARFASENERPVVLSLFWIGFTFLMPLASLLAKQFGSMVTMTVAALSGAASALTAAHANDLISLSVAHFICGAAWGAVMATTVTTAFALGRRGQAGTAAGAFFSLVAVATAMRIALLAAHGDKAPAVASALPLLPSVAWLAAALLLLPVARRMTQQRHIFASAAVPARR